MTTHDPETPVEWQEAVNAAEFFLALDSCKQYGLIQGGPVIDEARCLDILARGERLGYKPASMQELCAKFLSGRKA